MISASQEERATLGCFFEPHETVAELKSKVKPEVECFTAQSESLCPFSGEEEDS